MAAAAAGTSQLDQQQQQDGAARPPPAASRLKQSSDGGGGGSASVSDLVPLALPRAPGGATQPHLEYLVEQSRPCVLRPFCFFVSWQGVLTLVYKGFPQQLVTLKVGGGRYCIMLL